VPVGRAGGALHAPFAGLAQGLPESKNKKTGVQPHAPGILSLIRDISRPPILAVEIA